MCRNSLLAALFILLATNLCGQGLKGWSITGSLHRGSIIRHSPKLAYPIPPASTGATFDFRYQTFGRRQWQEWQGFPEYGLSLHYYYPGDPDILGHTIGLIPHLNLRVLERKRWNIRFQLGSGLAWFSRAYDPANNPLNNAIGSHLSNITAFRLDGGWYPNERWSIRLGGSFSHYSNAAVTSPNLGMNIPAVCLGVSYRPVPLNPDDYIRHGLSRKVIDHRWGFALNGLLGYRENSVPGGPKLPAYLVTLAGRYSLNRVNDLQVGFGYEYQRSVYEFALNSFSTSSNLEARRGATRWMFFVADEFRFGAVGIYLMAGLYISPESISLPAPITNSLGLRYYFRLPVKTNRPQECFISVLMKAHRGVAEYAALGLGYRW